MLALQMKKFSGPFTLIGIGFALVMIGFIIPLLMVMQVLQSTFFLNFLGYAASISGLMLGIIGTAMYASYNRKNRK
jgi:F0F1-type ATP synthase membrane subunit c/vacuolar-type H+-ATPase subunit K